VITESAGRRYKLIGFLMIVGGMVAGMIGCSAGGVGPGIIIDLVFMVPGLGVFLYGRSFD